MTTKTLADAIDPLPCPFCGKPGSIDEERSRGNPEHVVFVPSCSDSDCIGVLIQSFARRSEAIAAWNRRHTAEPTAAVREAAEEISNALVDGKITFEPDQIAAIILKHLATPAAQPAPAEGMREAFEAEARRYGFSAQKHGRDVGPYRVGDYADRWAAISWHFWQAAYQAAQSREPVDASKQRPDFEEWAAREFGPELPLNRVSGHWDYESEKTHAAWCAWWSARLTAPRAAATLTQQQSVGDGWTEKADSATSRTCRCEETRRLVDNQALDAGLWFIAETAAEAYLQQELRRIHAVIEGSTADGIAE